MAYIFYELLKQEEGGIGEYNRANRSLGHFVENAAGRKVFAHVVLMLAQKNDGLPSGNMRNHDSKT